MSSSLKIEPAIVHGNSNKGKHFLAGELHCGYFGNDKTGLEKSKFRKIL